VADTLVTLAEQDQPPLRTPIGADAQRLVAERRSIDDADYEAGVRRALRESAP
jgi:hypothetical protein